MTDEAPGNALTTDKIEVLRTWGRGLEQLGRQEELRAAGRAILLLAEEIDRLNRELWHLRAGVSDTVGGEEPSVRAAGQERAPADLVESLALRLAASLGSI